MTWHHTHGAGLCSRAHHISKAGGLAGLGVTACAGCCRCPAVSCWKLQVQLLAGMDLQQWLVMLPDTSCLPVPGFRLLGLSLADPQQPAAEGTWAAGECRF